MARVRGHAGDLDELIVGAAADRLGRVGKRLRTLPEEGIQSGSRIVRARVLRELAKDAGSDLKLSGIRNGVPQRVTVTKRSYNGGAVVVGRIMAGPPKQRAPWFWLEEGTQSGERRVRTTSRRHRGTLTTYFHPGTPAKRTWSRGVGEVLPEVRKEFERLYREALKG